MKASKPVAAIQKPKKARKISHEHDRLGYPAMLFVKRYDPPESTGAVDDVGSIHGDSVNVPTNEAIYAQFEAWVEAFRKDHNAQFPLEVRDHLDRLGRAWRDKSSQYTFA